MSKLYTIMAFTVMAMLLFSVAPAFAQEDGTVVNDSTTTTDDSNTTTDSADTSTNDSTTDDADTDELDDNLNESVSAGKVGWENFKLWFTFNNEKKAIQELKLARLRLIQAKVAAQSGNDDAMQRALDAHDRLIDRVKSRVDAVNGESSGKGIRSSAEKLVGLARAIEVHEARISKLNEILASENLTDEQRAKVEKRLSKVEENTAKLRDVQENKRDKLKTRLRAVTNLTEEEVESVIAEIEDAQNLSILKKKVAEAKHKNEERIKEKLEERIAKAREKLQEAKEKAEERLKDRLEKDSDDSDDSKDSGDSDDSDDSDDSNDSDDSKDSDESNDSDDSSNSGSNSGSGSN
ncbi:MAG TPA: hypothetical protein VI544_00610 [Candidatus Nanoarchaeia archaeon]|nr:hypothetical protein [Candidatus Nanoarchaeia archaeon]